MKKISVVVLLAGVVLFSFFAAHAFCANQDILDRWSKTKHFEDAETLSELDITVTYYSSEYIEALVQSEAEKNLWTNDEMENYKYELLKGLQVDEYVPIHIRFDNKGPAMHMAPFDRQITLWLGSEKLSPADYDKRFNFKLQGVRGGLVFFPRYDHETGESNLEGARTAKLSLKGSMGSATLRFGTVDFVWDIYKDDPARLWSGDAAAKLEIDRLIKRVEKLTAQKQELESQLSVVNEELVEINARIEELRSQ